MMKYTLQISDRKQHFSLREKVCIKVIESIENEMPEDFIIDLMDAYESLGSITGENDRRRFGQ